MKKINFKLNISNSFLNFLIAFLIFLILILIFFLNNITIAIVNGSSMEDTIHHKDILIVNKKSYNSQSPKRYDIVNVYSPYKYDNYLVKRIIGLPGDLIEIKDSTLFINGKKINEIYIKEEMNIPYKLKLKIPPGKFFIMGDNRNVSLDSRYLGLIKGEDIKGKTLFKYCVKTGKIKIF